MTDLELDDLIGRVLTDAIKLDCEKTEQQNIVFQPSARHQRQMKAMLKDPLCWAKTRKHPVWKLALQRAAVVLLVIAIGFGGIMAVSAPVRAAVVRWVVEFYETYLVYRYSGEDIVGAMPNYAITKLPDGYKETKRNEFPASAGIVYEDGSGGIISLDYVHMQDGVAFGLVWEDEDIILDVKVNGWRGQLYVPQDLADMKFLVWIDEKANIQFSMVANLEQDDMIALAESVKVK